MNLESAETFSLLQPFPEANTLLPRLFSAPASMATLSTTEELVEDPLSSSKSKIMCTKQARLPLVRIGLGIIGILLVVTLIVRRSRSSLIGNGNSKENQRVVLG